ncbi:MAG: porin, partial [Parvularculales bacterium]
MRKMLLGSTALATAGLIAAPGVAAELSVKVSGNMNGGFYVADTDDNVIDAPAKYGLRSSPANFDWNAANASHPHNLGQETPAVLIQAATCDHLMNTMNTETFLPVGDPMSDNFGRCVNDRDATDTEPVSWGGLPTGTAANTLYRIQTEEATERVDEYSQTQAKLGFGRIVVDADAVLENGLRVGGRVRIEAFGEEDANDFIEDHYMYLSGGFGRILIGAKEGASYQMHYSAPWFVPGNGVDSPNFYNMSRTSVRTNTYAQMSGEAIKLTYFTPRVGGFQLGASYTPSNDDKNGLPNGFGLQAEGGPGSKDVEDIIDLSVNYVIRNYRDTEIALSAGWESGTTNVVGVEDDPSNWAIGGSFKWRTLTFGGSYYSGDNIENTLETSDREVNAWSAGVAWNSGPWSAGVAYLEATAEGGMKFDGVTYTPLGDEQNSFLQFGGGYALGRGVDIGVEYQLIEDDNGDNTNETRNLKSSS